MGSERGTRVAAGWYHIQNVNSLHTRYERFIKPFCGPATKNTPKKICGGDQNARPRAEADHRLADERILVEPDLGYLPVGDRVVAKFPNAKTSVRCVASVAALVCQSGVDVPMSKRAKLADHKLLSTTYLLCSCAQQISWVH